MMEKLKELVNISNFYGKNPEFVIAGGGNTSFKNNDHLWIKASGTSLATITEEGFAKLDRDCLETISTKNYSKDPFIRESEVKDDLYHCTENKSKRPSVETSLHNLIDFSFVVHTHPTLINGLMCSKNAREETKSLFGDNALFIEYSDPGYTLFKLVEQRVKEYKERFNQEPKIIFLANHGVFVSSGSTGEIKEMYTEISNKIRAKLRQEMPSFTLTDHKLSGYINTLATKTGLYAKGFNSNLIQHFVDHSASFEKVNTAFTPDNIVYCKAHYLFIECDPDKIMEEYCHFEKEFSFPPRVIGVKGKGIICMEEDEKSVNTVYEMYQDILKVSFLTESFGGPKFLSKEQIEFIDTWEVENYRRKIAKQG
ncbi:class II aldolase/adducin family protein [Bacteroidota bacterium]